MLNLLMLYAAYARVRALRETGCPERKKGNHNRRDDFQRFCFHMFIFVRFSQLATQTDVRRAELHAIVAIGAIALGRAAL